VNKRPFLSIIISPQILKRGVSDIFIMLNLGQKPLYLAILACIQLFGIALFCKGFFPYKIYLPGYATKDDLPSSFLHNEPEFDRLVFIVIDALRK
jgi:hypothetical protein